MTEPQVYPDIAARCLPLITKVGAELELRLLDDSRRDALDVDRPSRPSRGPLMITNQGAF
jgi:hypothetical protein